MKCIDRIKPEVLKKLNEYKEEYPHLSAEIFEELNIAYTWTRLPYSIAIDIQNLSDKEYLGDCFYTIEETEKLIEKTI